ncbi:hypothetical protein [Bradyrhizobium brasilense]|uniref:hypothetical protein n=1 Tax=Bradyrhizobium brasilense TaxID=1419277 RepID=UPI00116003E8|nr:hypothetical protein [Bradyrhizobium brasilense]
MRDHTLPYWRNNVDAESIFEGFSHRPERAKAWLRHRKVSETCIGFECAVMMNGHFEGGVLSDHTYHWTFTPGRKGDHAIVVPVYEQGRLVDMLAISRHDHRVWGCVTGAGQYVGNFTDASRTDRTQPAVVHVHDTPYSWFMSGCEGILPLAKAFFPLMQLASSIVAQGYEHAWQIANEAFIYPAERLGLDCEAAELAAFDRISFGVSAC